MTKKKAAISITIDHHLYDWLRVQPQKMSAVINTILAKHVANHMIEDEKFMASLRARSVPGLCVGCSGPLVVGSGNKVTCKNRCWDVNS